MAGRNKPPAILPKHNIRRSNALNQLMLVFLQHPAEEFYGMQLGDLTGLGPASVYPLLRKLVQAELLTSRVDTTDRKRPLATRRVYYKLTATGYELGLQLLTVGLIITPRQ